MAFAVLMKMPVRCFWGRGPCEVVVWDGCAVVEGNGSLDVEAQGELPRVRPLVTRSLWRCQLGDLLGSQMAVPEGSEIVGGSLWHDSLLPRGRAFVVFHGSSGTREKPGDAAERKRKWRTDGALGSGELRGGYLSPVEWLPVLRTPLRLHGKVGKED